VDRAQVNARRAAWITLDRMQLVVEDNPIGFMRELEQCAAVGGASAELLAKLRAGLDRWARVGGSFDQCMGWRVSPGGRHKTARAQLVAAARRKVVRTLVVAVAGENPHRQTQAILPVVAGDSPPPSAEASQALDELRALGAKMPRSKGGIYSLVLQAISVK
jgi:hypothetical protein